MAYFLYVETGIVSDAENEEAAIKEANEIISERAARGMLEWSVEEEDE